MKRGNEFNKFGLQTDPTKIKRSGGDQEIAIVNFTSLNDAGGNNVLFHSLSILYTFYSKRAPSSRYFGPQFTEGVNDVAPKCL